jgi:multidrug efflux pump subunit AcrA (membrane-fusion protein)
MTSGDGARGRWAWAGLLAALALAGLALAGRARLLVPFAAGAAEEPPPVGAAPPPAENGVAALGRLQPKDGVRRIAGPAQSVAVVGRLLVDKGDRVRLTMEPSGRA